MKRSQTLTDENGTWSMQIYDLFPGLYAAKNLFRIAGFTEEREKSDRMEINFCVNGRFECEFTERDIAILKPGDMAVSKFDGENGTKTFSRFPMNYYEGLCIIADCAKATSWMKQSLGVLSTDLNLLKDKLLSAHWYWAGEAGYRCEHVFRELYDSLDNEELPYLRLKTVELLMLLQELPPSARTASYYPHSQISLIKHIRDHMITNSSSWLSVEQLAKEHNLSVSQLQKLFREQYGTSIYQYLKEYRLEQAAVALLNTRKPVMEIAQNAGFSNASKFSEGFRRRYGMTPSAYRAARKLQSEME